MSVEVPRHAPYKIKKAFREDNIWETHNHFFPGKLFSAQFLHWLGWFCKPPHRIKLSRRTGENTNVNMLTFIVMCLSFLHVKKGVIHFSNKGFQPFLLRVDKARTTTAADKFWHCIQAPCSKVEGGESIMGLVGYSCDI